MACNYYQTKHWRDLRMRCLRRDHFHCAAKGCTRRAVVADHIVTRPRSDEPTALDRLDNLRSLCLSHDAQVKEMRGIRKNGGVFRIKGCDVDGWPLSPEHRK